MADRRVKGCPNPNCKAYKKIRFKATDEYCTQCSSRLVFVCAKCWSPLATDDKKVRICGVCEAKAKDRNQKVIKGLKNAAGVVPGVVGIVVGKSLKK